MIRSGPNITTASNLTEKLNLWYSYREKYRTIVTDGDNCLHHKPVLHHLYNIDELPASQLSSQSTVEDFI